MTTPTPSHSTFSWREVVEQIDGPERHVQSLYPTVYTFSNQTTFRDSGPQGGPYA